ncbi:LO7 [Rhynchobatus djiddensis adomavirus 1]|uniref:LO7 n=1 Tax=Rhynchobatus djiddensis adomavirus 1 TaxID=2175117 RepID=A0A2S1MK38_9VIRU|nr:LO7 [Rhynchobatus djiddensis adomavirus 1]AWG87398.1 LO7 [Rhynchobatus djiddensis adomavirus 1]
MTTTSPDAFDIDLSTLPMTNANRQHVSANLARRVYKREASEQTLTDNVNKDGITETLINVQCGHDESILLGSFTFEISGHVKRADIPNWQSVDAARQHFAPIGPGNAVGPVPLPPFIANSQFQVIDLRVGAAGSLNVFLANQRSSTGHCGALGFLNKYTNLPEEDGAMQEGYLGDIEGHSYRDTLQVDSFDSPFKGYEPLYHQLNNPTNLLVEMDVIEEETIVPLPAGMPLQLRFVTVAGPQRRNIMRSPDQRQHWQIEFDSFKVTWTCIKLTDDSREEEKDIVTYPTLDIGLQVHQLPVGNTSIVIPITRSEMQLVPQYLLIFIGHQDTFNPEYMSVGTLHGLHRDILATMRLTVNGDLNPEFMSPFQAYTIDLTDLTARRQMRQAWCARLGRSITKGTYRDRPLMESHMRRNVTTSLGCSSFAIMTDPGMTVIREACSGGIAGRIDALITFQRPIAANMALYVMYCTKQAITFERQVTANGLSSSWTISDIFTRPAYTEVYHENQLTTGAHQTDDRMPM